MVPMGYFSEVLQDDIDNVWRHVDLPPPPPLAVGVVVGGRLVAGVLVVVGVAGRHVGVRGEADGGSVGVGEGDGNIDLVMLLLCITKFSYKMLNVEKIL